MTLIRVKNGFDAECCSSFLRFFMEFGEPEGETVNVA